MRETSRQYQCIPVNQTAVSVESEGAEHEQKLLLVLRKGLFPGGEGLGDPIVRGVVNIFSEENQLNARIRPKFRQSHGKFDDLLITDGGIGVEKQNLAM